MIEVLDTVMVESVEGIDTVLLSDGDEGDVGSGFTYGIVSRLVTVSVYSEWLL